MPGEMESRIRVAGLTVALYHTHDYLRRLCRDYLVPPTAAPDLTVSLDPGEIEAEAARPGGLRGTPGQVESLCLCRKLADLLPTYGVLLFHAAAVRVGERGFAFAGPSGIGKSTHAGLWAEYFGATFVNGDKPLLICRENEVLVCGSPWAGKEGRQQNVTVPLGGLCFVRRAKENRIRRLPAEEAAARLLSQSLTPREADAAGSWLTLLDRVARLVPLWEIECDISRRAAELSYRTMTGSP